MKKSLILTGFNPLLVTGGVETFTREVCKLLLSSGIEPECRFVADFKNTYNLKNAFIGKLYAAGRSLLPLRNESIDFILLNGYYGGGYFPKNIKTYAVFHSTHAGYAEAIKEFIPRSTYLEIRYLIGEILERSSAASANLIAVSERVRLELKNYYGFEDIDVIANPIDTNFFSRLTNTDEIRLRYGIPLHGSVGLFVGRWEISKGADIVQKIMEEMKEIFWVLVIATGNAFHLTDKGIIVLSGLSREQMKEIYSVCDFMLFPSRYEGFGLAAAEAMACGLPVIGKPIGFLSEVYIHDPFAKIAIPTFLKDTDEISFIAKEIITKLCSDSQLYQEVADHGRAMISQLFAQPIWEQKMKSVLCLG